MSCSNLDSKLINEYFNYYCKYYGAEYRYGQGLDEITDTISHYSKQGTWLDLGGGTSSFIWLPAFHGIKKVYTVDKFEEAFYVQKMVREKAPSGCYQHILDRYGKSYESLNHIPIEFMQADLLENINIPLSCDNVTQFGLLGLCSSKEQYFRQLDHFISLMNLGAVFIGANWIFSKKYRSECHLDNTYIKVGIIKEWAETRGRTLLEETMIQIQNDRNYDSVLVYAFV